MPPHPLAAILEAAGRGRFPAPDGTVDVFPAPPRYPAAVVAFTAHSVVAADVPAEEILSQLDPTDFGATMSAPFLVWLGQRVGARPGVLDVTLVHPSGGRGDVALVPRPDLTTHPRVALALSKREDVRAYSDPSGQGLITLGRGLAGRRELSVEIAEAARDAGLGRKLIVAGLALLAPGEPVFAQISPGNARSLRAFLAVGFRPIGSEVLYQ
jgi:hypothetical protein